jgi:hypothetical protein
MCVCVCERERERKECDLDIVGRSRCNSSIDSVVVKESVFILNPVHQVRRAAPSTDFCS